MNFEGELYLFVGEIVNNLNGQAYKFNDKNCRA